VMVILALTFLGAIPPTADSPEAWKGLTAEQIKKVKQGEIVILTKQGSGEEERFIKAAMIINQPIDVVWNLLCQTWRQEEYLPGLISSPLIEKHKDWNIVEFNVKVLFIKINYRVKHYIDSEHYYLHWNLDPSYHNDLKHLEGYYWLYKIDDKHTLIRYGTVVVVSELIPRSIQDALTKRDLPKNLQAVKKWLDSAGTYKKPDYQKLKKAS